MSNLFSSIVKKNRNLKFCNIFYSKPNKKMKKGLIYVVYKDLMGCMFLQISY